MEIKNQLHKLLQQQSQPHLLRQVYQDAPPLNYQQQQLLQPLRQHLNTTMTIITMYQMWNWFVVKVHHHHEHQEQININLLEVLLFVFGLMLSNHWIVICVSIIVWLRMEIVQILVIVDGMLKNILILKVFEIKEKSIFFVK